VAKRRFDAPKRRKINEYRGACEGSQESMYFVHLKRLIQKEEQRKYDVQFSLICTKGGSPLIVAKRADVALAGEIERLAAFDYDGKHDEFIDALDFCKEKEIVYGYSNYCFDLWLLLHKEIYMKVVTNASSYESEIRSVYNLPEEADIKEEVIVEKILSQISLDDVRRAVVNAEYIVADNKQVKEPHYTNKSEKFYDNPDLSIHRFIEKVLRDVGL
jgi:CRISPR/Cas system-associated protein endoribonuclease Cas2